MSGTQRTRSRDPVPRRALSRHLLIGLFLLVLLLVLNSSIFLIYRQVRGQIAEELGQRLLAIANTAAAGIEGNLVLAARDDPSAGDALELQSFLQRVRLETGVGDLYIVDAARHHVIDADARYPAGYENPALELHYAAATAALAGVPEASGLYEIGGVYLRTAFAPIKDARGEVIGILAAEGGADFFDGLWDLRRRVLVIGSAGMVLMLALASLFLRMLRAQALTAQALRETSALAAAGELAAIMAHEIRNPLTIISSRAERVAAKIAAGRPAEEVLEWFGAVPREIARLDQVLTQYLGFARPGGAKSDTAALGPALDAVLSLLRSDFERRGIEVLRDDGPTRDLRLAISSVALHQILLNLMLNARDALEQGGQVKVSARPAGRRVALRIADNGCGMSAEQQRRAFELFYTTKPKGSGLGLAVVRSMCNLYGAKIVMESEPGKGTTFTIAVPLASTPRGRAVQEAGA